MAPFQILSFPVGDGKPKGLTGFKLQQPLLTKAEKALEVLVELQLRVLCCLSLFLSMTLSNGRSSA